MNDIRAPRPEEIAGRLPKRIVIVGNNESAWMAAAYLGRQIPKLGCRISVLSSGEPSAEFFGESSLPSLRGLVANCAVDEHDMMRETQATYQLATQFSDWVQKERDFWKPFSNAERQSTVSLFDAWFSERSAGRLLRPFHSYSLHWGAALAGKSPYGFSGPSAISQSGSYAFHLDGHDFALWLRKIALATGVEEIDSEIDRVQSNGRGGIAQIRLVAGSAVAGDFFIDCSAGGSKLLATVPQSFLRWNESLLCDRMLTIRLPGRRQVPPYTRMTGMASGWSWQIPLATTMEIGYAYASMFATDETALQELREAVTLDGVKMPDGIVPEFRSINYGMESQFWRDNVLTLGSSACVMDPLVSAGRHICQLGIETFVELFPERNAKKSVIEYYNERMITAVEEIRDFAQLHYVLSKRKDSPFWTEATQAPISANLSERLALYSATGSIGPLAPEAFGETNYRFLLAGCGRLPSQPTVHARAADPNRIQQSLRSLLKSNETALKDLPLHEELLDWIHVERQSLQKSA